MIGSVIYVAYNRPGLALKAVTCIWLVGVTLMFCRTSLLNSVEMITWFSCKRDILTMLSTILNTNTISSYNAVEFLL